MYNNTNDAAIDVGALTWVGIEISHVVTTLKKWEVGEVNRKKIHVNNKGT